MSETHALYLIARLSGFVALLQTIELLGLRDWLRSGGVWSWPVLQNDYKLWPGWLVTWLGRYLGGNSFSWLLWFRLIISVFVIFRPEIFGLALLWASAVMISMRFRGAFNGGSDSMTVLTLSALLIGFLMPNSQQLTHLALVLITAQVVISYVFAGWYKFAVREWRNGTAVGLLLRSAPFWPEAIAPSKQRLMERFSQVASFATLLFECFFFLALLSPALCVAFLSAGVVFHWFNHRVFGLNRFFWAWVITYPALLSVVKSLN